MAVVKWYMPEINETNFKTFKAKLIQYSNKSTQRVQIYANFKI